MERAMIESPRVLISGATGVWAGQQLLRAMREGRPLNSGLLRTNDTLRKDEWIHFDRAVIEEATIRLRAVADLLNAGLTMPVGMALGKTVIEWERVTDMNPAEVSLAGVSRAQYDRVEYTPAQVPNPIVHKDFQINLRTLIASRTLGEPLDTTQVRLATRLVSEGIENLLVNGGPTFGGLPLYGYRTHPDRNTVTFEATGGHWGAAAKTGAQIIEDVTTMIQAAEADRYFGPFVLYVPTDAGTKLSQDYKDNYAKTIAERIREFEQIQDIRVLDTLPSANVLLVQMTSDVVQMAVGEQIQPVQWDVAGGFLINFKVWGLMVPVVKSTASGKSGIVHMTPA